MKLPLFVWTWVSWWGGDFHLNAVDLDGTSEVMANTTNQLIWIANAYTYEIWFKTPATVAWIVFYMDAWNNTNHLDFRFSSGKIYAKMIWNNGSSQKVYIWATTLSWNTKYRAVITWDWTNFDIKLNDTADTPYLKGTDNALTMTDTARYITIWWYRGIPNANIIVSKFSMWNTALSDAELTSLYDGWDWYNLDLRDSIWDYTSTSNLKHQWALWKDTWTNIWADYVSSWNINISNNSVNVTDADIITF